ncbi:hypothetical protein HYO02_22290 [Vibrio parahaemolyticus]|nr:hypothetical protein [Vibrio parahaemolyticus]MBE3926576.1 hypothetical protein [Vibrio parahaemolyticus]MBE4103247.1 hypothetical protein [Vibrio parahaemolyticus]MBM5073270.1 hypothetical protein [Vibrio parahaemolyticus]HCG8575808.1 hypothetical protein [Vibrio parahaemolyticus]
MSNVFSIIWLNVKDAFKRKNENPDEPYVQENFDNQMEIAKQHEPETYKEFKDK